MDDERQPLSVPVPFSHAKVPADALRRGHVPRQEAPGVRACKRRRGRPTAAMGEDRVPLDALRRRAEPAMPGRSMAQPVALQLLRTLARRSTGSHVG